MGLQRWRRSQGEVVQRGKRFDLKEASETGDHYVISQLGDLQRKDAEGIGATARRIK